MDQELAAYLKHIDLLRAIPAAAKQIRYEERVFAFLDVLGDPAQLGWLRARGLITADTVTVVGFDL